MIYHSDGSRPVLEEVKAELDRQYDRWGPQDHEDGTGPDVLFTDIRHSFQEITNGLKNHNDFIEQCGIAPKWAPILLEEVFEAVSEKDQDNVREELIQVAAVAVQWIRAIDRRQ